MVTDNADNADKGDSADSPSGYVQPVIDTQALAELLDGEYAEVRRLVRTNLVAYADVLEEAEQLGFDEFRERVREIVVEMAATGQTGMGFPKEYGGGGDVGASIAAFETLAFGDLSVLVKVGVQFGLFGGAILQLGTEHHHETYLPDVVTGKLMGCFAMTETGHGSNVQALGTVARYDAGTQEFVITTGDDQARKDYIGNAARHAELAVVFAQLEVGGERQGVHAFVVPIRVATASWPPVYASRTTAARWASTAWTTAGSGSTACACRARHCSTGSPTSPRRASTRARSRTRAAASSPCSAPSCRAGSASRAAPSTPPRSLSRSPSKYALRRRQFEAASDAERAACSSTTACTSGGCSRCSPRTYALHFAQDVMRTQLHEVFSAGADDDQARRELEARAAGIKALGTWHATRDDPGVPRGVRRRRAISPSTGSPR